VSLRIGIDVGGTFTDFLVSDDATNDVTSWKTPTSRPDPSVGVFEGLGELVKRGLVRPREVTEVSVSNTVALNAVLERKGARTGMLMTRGFRDILEIARERRRSLYDLQQENLPVLIPRYLRVEVDERVNAAGEVLRPLDLEQARQALRLLARQGVEAVAVCLLHAYANPDHERRIKQLAQTEFPKLFISLSHEVLREYREYERATITTLNAYVMPVMRQYLNGLENGIRRLNPLSVAFVAHSGGGVMGIRATRERAIHTAFSGPSAGVRGATYLASLAGCREFITMDMGGTSCDVAVVQGGTPEMTSRSAVAGYPLSLRTVDIHSISAGGGTIAWVDNGGLLRVGPESTGSVPGPACYQRGGTRPTITDAHVVLGHIDTENRLAGSIELSVDAATDAIAREVAGPLGLELAEAAAGILTIADAAMVRAIEVVSLERGLNPGDFTLIAFGGAAPLHASSIARQLGIGRVLVPKQAGVLCALGTLCCDERYEVTRTILITTGDARSGGLATILRDMELEARALPEGPELAAMRVSYGFDLRYHGQTSSLEVAVEVIDAPDMPTRLAAEFERRYRETFGYTMPDTVVEIERARVTIRVPRSAPDLRLLNTTRTVARPRARNWLAHFDQHGFLSCALYQLDDLVSAEVVQGPAVINAFGSTILVHPNQTASVDPHGSVVISTAAGN
jgi:N-methylhydantoinase A